MPSVSRQIAASPEQVFAVLADGWLYASWVVGAARIRDVDAGWPAPGTRIHHSVGAWPLLIHDVSAVVEVEPPSMLLLNVRFWPAGHGHVRFRLYDLGGRTELTMAEEPSGGPARWVHNPVLDALIGARNRETLLRLAWIAEGRRADAAQPRSRASG